MKVINGKALHTGDSNESFFYLRNALPPQMVSQLRARITQSSSLSARPTGSELVSGQLYPHEIFDAGLATLSLLESGILERFKERWKSEIFLLPDLNVHVNQFGNHHKGAGWHRDCFNELSRRRTYLFDRNYRLWKVGIYLQDNDSKFGGGINIVPCSREQMVGKRVGAPKNVTFRSVEATVKQKLSLLRGSARFLPLQAGDAFAFDSRVLHQSTPCSTSRGVGEPKVVLYFNVTDCQKSANFYLWNVFLRAFEEKSRLQREALSLGDDRLSSAGFKDASGVTFVVLPTVLDDLRLDFDSPFGKRSVSCGEELSLEF